jgi:hypothetical protein
MSGFNNLDIELYRGTLKGIVGDLLDIIDSHRRTKSLTNSEVGDYIKNISTLAVGESRALMALDVDIELKKVEVEIRKKELEIKEKQLLEIDSSIRLREAQIKSIDKDNELKDANIRLTEANIKAREKELEILDKNLKLKDIEIELSEVKKRYDEKNIEFINRQIRSFDDKLLIDMLQMENRSWGLMLSSNVIDIVDDNGELVSAIPDFLKNKEFMKIYNTLWNRIDSNKDD